MRNTLVTAMALWMFVPGLSGCGDNSSFATPTGPSPVAPQAVPAAPRLPVSWLDGYTLTGVGLSGVVYELTPTGRVPIPGASIYCELCGTETHTFATADANGFYMFSGDLASGGGVWLSGRPVTIFVDKEGYRDPAGLAPVPGCPASYNCRAVLFSGDTRLDIELVRR